MTCTVTQLLECRIWNVTYLRQIGCNSPLTWWVDFVTTCNPARVHPAWVYTEIFKSLRLDLSEFNLVILPLGSRWALMKYHIKSKQKHKVFGKIFMDMICFYIRRDYVNTSAVSHRDWGCLKKSDRFLLKP